MSDVTEASAIVIRDIDRLEELRAVEALQKEVWGCNDLDVVPLTMLVATREVGGVLIGAYDRSELAGFVYGFPGYEDGRATHHSHMLAVKPAYRNHYLGYKLKLAQRERALAMGIRQMTWTFDPLQSKNAHFNFAKLGVVSEKYKADFYGLKTSSVLHRNSTDRLWVQWRLSSKRVQQRLQGKDASSDSLDALSNLIPLVGFDGDGKPVKTDMETALGRQRICIEIPSEINAVEQKDPALAREWRAATRWAFKESLAAGFFVAEFCRSIRGRQGPGAYLLQKGTVKEFVPDF